MIDDDIYIPFVTCLTKTFLIVGMKNCSSKAPNLNIYIYIYIYIYILALRLVETKIYPSERSSS